MLRTIKDNGVREHGGLYRSLIVDDDSNEWYIYTVGIFSGGPGWFTNSAGEVVSHDTELFKHVFFPFMQHTVLFSGI